ncbi:DUF5681 domain-containing protein [Legionella cincinnatiensis]|uniref:DUF5681 domain-containing protein n=1 Tax=Legionella cincinnatiensis TaxID=28085 RepID=A0A378IPS0_9GAMM|nr:DUF5681 domain-containing protein [Legionella cincinnatiensis]KTC84336.1 hypothetical protein Lcin_1899 [Legionella cincinnatiensis]STX34014.1 Uncharacterised protein [Legionella cincinnatiensis]
MAKFKPGESGNPRGKKAGILNKRTELIKAFETHAGALINKTIDLALSGDTIALRLCIERLVPKAVNKAATVFIPDLSMTETTKIIPELLKSLSGQEISVSDMKNLMDIFIAHDDEVAAKNKKHEKLEITTKNPIEAAKIYQQIMMRKI